MKLTKDFATRNKNYFKVKNKIEKITIHESANYSKGAGAKNHAIYINKPDTRITWHITIDDKHAIQHFPFDVSAWHAGSYTGNTTSIGIEMCVNPESDYNQTVLNTIDIVKQLMKQYNLTADDVVQHNYWNGKNCPLEMRSGRRGWTWSKFKSMLVDTPQAPTAKPTNTYTVRKGDSLWGIAQSELGDGERYPEIKQWNNLKTDLINPGDKLTIRANNTYTVKPNDSFWKIAKEQLGNGNRYTELAEYNNLQPYSIIHPGQVLKIPTEARRPKLYTVKKNDSFWKIAQEQMGDGNRYKELAIHNGLDVNAVIHPGQVLKLPN